MEKILFSLFIAICASRTVLAGETCLHYGEPAVTLEGRVALRSFYGPPGYGETPKIDAREQQAILLLEKAVCTRAGSDDYDVAETNQNQITLGSRPGLKLSAYSKARVRVSGTLFHAHTGHHHTAVLMTLQSIDKLNK